MVFKTKRKIEVFSDVYNLAGDIHQRPNFLKTMVFSQTMYKSHPSMGQAITDGYLNGPGIKLRQVIPTAHRENFYATVGQSQAVIRSLGNLDAAAVRDALNFRLNISASVYEVEMGAPNIYWWGLQYLLDEHPERVSEIFDVSVNEAGTSLQVDFYTNPEDEEPVESLEFPSDPEEIDNTSDYLFAVYGVQAVPGLIEEEDEPTEEVDDFSAVVGFGDPVTVVTEDVTYEWDETVTVRDVYSNYEDTQDFVLPKSDTRSVTVKTYRKITDIPATPENAQALRIEETYVMTEGFKLVPEIEETVEEFDDFTRYTTVTDSRVEPAKFSQYNKKTYEVYAVNDQKAFIYKRGTDPIFDALFEDAIESDYFFPVIPIKYDSNPGTKPRPIYISDSNDSLDRQIYAKSKRVLAKASTKTGYDDIVATLKDNGGANGINYAYVLFGSSLNSPAFTAKKYIYEFFKLYGDYSSESANVFNSYLQARQVAQESREDWVAWNDAQQNPANPLYGTPEPLIIPYPRVPERSVSLRSTRKLNLDYKVSWAHISSETGTGRLNDQAPRSIQIEKANSSIPVTDLDIEIIDGNIQQITTINPRSGAIRIRYQIDEDNWEVLTVDGLISVNMIHRGKSINISAHAALDDDEESGFIIPLHETPFRSMRLVDATQFAGSNTYLMLNYYSDTKQKWYQTKAFKIIITVVIIVVSVFSAGAGAGAGAGAASIGSQVAAAVGLTGVAATVFAAAVNAIAGLIISRIVSQAAIALLGDEIGMIVGAIVSMVAVGAMNSYFAGQPINLLDSFNSVNLLKLAGTISGDLAKYYQEKVVALQKEAQNYVEEFKKESDKLNKLFSEEFGNRAYIDPIDFYQRIMESAPMYETPDQFFARTLMTGSDICNVSLNALGEVINLDNSLILA